MAFRPLESPAMTDFEPEEDLPPVAHVIMVYNGPVAPHWEMKVRYGDQKMLDEFWTRVNARLLLLPKHDPQFRRNRERVNRDAERELIICDWDLGEDDAETTSTPTSMPAQAAAEPAEAPAAEAEEAVEEAAADAPVAEEVEAEVTEAEDTEVETDEVETGEAEVTEAETDEAVESDAEVAAEAEAAGQA